MRARAFDAVLLITPLILLLAAMGMVEVLAVLFLLAAIGLTRAQWSQILTELKQDRFFLCLLLTVFVWPLITSVWSLAPALSAISSFKLAGLCLAGAIALKASQFLPALPASYARHLLIMLLAPCLFLASEILPNGGLIYYAANHMPGGDYTRFLHKTVNRGLCAFVVIVWPVLFLVYRQQRQHFWKLFTLAALLLAAPVLDMQSLSAQLGFACGFLAFGLMQIMPKLLPRLLVVVVPAVFMLLPLFFHWLLQLPAIEPYLPWLFTISSGRTLIWKSMFENLPDNIWVGYGMNTTPMVHMSDELIKGLDLHEPIRHPHLTPLQVLFDTGVIGLMLMGATLWLWFKRLAAISTDDKAQSFAIALSIAYITAGISSFNVWQNWWFSLPWLGAILWQRARTAKLS